MSKRIIMSVLFSGVVSLMGYLFGAGGPAGGPAQATVTIAMPEGCLLVSPKNEVEGITGAMALVNHKPGITTFTFDMDGKQVDVDRDLKPGQQTWRVTSADLGQ